jgi:hypothetical protein
MQDSKSTLWFSFDSSITPIKTLATVETSLKSSVIKRTKKRERSRGKRKQWQKSVKIEQRVKIIFFENLLLLKSKSTKLMKVRQ